MIRIEDWAGRGCNSLRLHQKEIVMIILLEKFQGKGQDDEPDPSNKRSR